MAKKIAIASKIGVSVKGVFEDFVVAQTAKGYTEKTIANYPRFSSMLTFPFSSMVSVMCLMCFS